MNENPSPLFIQRLARWSVGAVRENRLSLMSSLVFGLLAYTYAFTNKLPNHDDVGQLFAKGATIDSGRWGLNLMERIFPNFSMPWIYGILTLALMAIAIVVILQVFAIRNRLLQVVLSGSILVFPSLIGLFGYMFTSTSYAVSFLLAVLGVWFIQKWRLRDTLWALACMVLSLSIYQSYVAVSASLLVILVVQHLLQGMAPGKALLRGVGYVAFLIASLAGYFLATQILLRLLNVSFNDYAAGATQFSLSSLPGNILAAYRMFLAFFTHGIHALVPNKTSQVLHLALVAMTAVLLVLHGRRKQLRGWFACLLLAVVIAVLPLAVCCMYLITSAQSIHTLVLYSFTALYVLVAVLAEPLMEGRFPGKAEELLRRACLEFTPVLLGLIVLVNTYVANQAYLNMHLRYENAFAFFSTVAASVQQQEEFTPQTKLILAGSYQEPAFYQEQFPFLYQLQGSLGFTPGSYTYGYFLNYFLGWSIPLATQEDAAAILATEAYQAMTIYPYHGSIQMIDGFLVVRMS